MTTSSTITSIREFADQTENSLDILNMARIAESAERFPDMCILMSKLVEIKCKFAVGEKERGLEVEERNLLSVAYKNVVGTKRSSWRSLSSGTIADATMEDINKMKLKIEGELQTICKEVIRLLGPADIEQFYNDHIKDKKDRATPQYAKNTLLVGTEDVKNQKIMDAETLVFYLKMVGDYCRYLAEIGNVEAKGVTEYYYTLAHQAADELAETHPTRLGLALNFSVCYYEIMKKPEEACKLAKEAFDGAIEKLDTLNDASYKDSTLIMQLLRDNLTLWTSDAQKEDNP